MQLKTYKIKCSLKHKTVCENCVNFKTSCQIIIGYKKVNIWSCRLILKKLIKHNWFLHWLRNADLHFPLLFSKISCHNWKIACLLISFQTTEFQYVKQSTINIWHVVWGFFFWYGYDYNILTNFGLPKVFMLLLMVTKVRFGNLMAPDHLEMISSWMPSTDQTVFI